MDKARELLQRLIAAWPTGDLVKISGIVYDARAYLAQPDPAPEAAPCAHAFEVRTGAGQAWTECKKCGIKVAPAAPQPEAAPCRHVNWKSGPQCPDCYVRDEPGAPKDKL